MRHLLIPGLALLALGALPAAAQESGGVALLPSAIGGPVGLARPLPMTFASITAGDVQASVMPDAQQRRQRHQEMIARVRGDAGFLGGFAFGQPLAPSRQRLPPLEEVAPLPEPVIFAPTFIRRRSTRVRVVNNNTFEAPVAVTVGDGNVVLQQGAGGNGGGGGNGGNGGNGGRNGGGAVAQQQVVTIGGNGVTSGGGNTNVVLPSGGIRQAAAGAGLRRARGDAGQVSLAPRRHAGSRASLPGRSPG